MSVIIIRYKKTVRNLLCRFFSKILKDIIVKIDKNDKKKQFKTAKTVRFDQKTLTNSRNKSKINSDTKNNENYSKRSRGYILEKKELTRGSGILLAISSLPSSYGIGTLGNAAFRFVDLLVDLKQKYWQVLPIGPTSFGDSPYQAMSVFAGNPYLIDLDNLIDEGLLSQNEISSYKWGNDRTGIDYAVLFENRYKILRQAFGRFRREQEAFLKFQMEQKDWLEDYALFMAIKHEHHDESWERWEEDLRKREPAALENSRERLKEDICFWKFCQYEFYNQWKALKEYANTRGVRIIGDVSFYMGLDSADVWANQELFLLEPDGTPSCVAAAVPDKFSSHGQVWGNPVYNWKRMEESGFLWWKRRILNRTKMFDVIRIDHFLGIVKDYTVPYGAWNASNGKWLKGPGRKLTNALNEVIGDCYFIADDYGGKTPIPGVKKLLDKAGWPGMKVLMFAFDGDTANEHLPHNYIDHHTVVYAGTHDNETIVGYFHEKTEYELAYIYEYLNISSKEDIPDALIRAAYASTADIAIIQMQDVLKLGNEARMNAPSTVGLNWRWRLGTEQLSEERRTWIRNLAAVYRR